MRSFKNISSDLNEQVPNEWEVTKLNLIANLRRGPFGGALKVDSFVPEGYAVYEQQHAIHKKLSNIRYFIDEKKYKEMQAFKVEENDILLSCSGTIGESVIIPTNYKEGIINQALLRTRLLRPDINIEYFKYYMDSFLFQTLITDNSHGSAMKNIASINVINKIPVPVPSEDEQEKIVLMLNSKLKVLDRTIDMKYKILELLEEQRQSIITESVTKGLNPNVKMKDSGVEWIGEIPENWGVRKIKEIANVHSSNVDKKSVEGEKEVLLCNYVDVYYNDSITANLDFMKATAKEEQIKTFTLKKHDVIITKDSESPTDIAVPTWVSQDLDGVVCGYHLSLIRCFEGALGHYLYYSLESAQIREHFYTRANGVTRFGLSKEAIKNGLIALPPMNEQLEIAEKLYRVNQEISFAKKKIKVQIGKLKEYRQALIYEAVTGKIDVRDMELD